jgi:hypothetical protein
MDLGSVLLGLALLALVAFIVARPLLERRGMREKEITPADRRLADYEQTLTALRDLDFDHATGKITDEDHTSQRTQLVAKGAALLRQLDALGVKPAAATDDDEIEQAVAARRKTATAAAVDDRIEAEVAVRRKAAAGAVCPTCSTPYLPGDRFCAKCGTKLPQAESAG